MKIKGNILDSMLQGEQGGTAIFRWVTFPLPPPPPPPQGNHANVFFSDMKENSS